MLNKKYAYRLEFMMVTGILVILILIGRMFYLQIVKGSTYRRQAEGNRTRYTRILAPRGIIYDCNGEELANNKPGVMVSLVRRTDGYREETLERLSQLLTSRRPSVSPEAVRNPSVWSGTPLRKWWTRWRKTFAICPG